MFAIVCVFNQKSLYLRKIYTMSTPAIVKKAAKELIQMYGDKFDFLGKYEGADAYMYVFPDDCSTGYPIVYLLKDDKVDVVTDTPALYIIELLVEDVDVSDVE